MVEVMGRQMAVATARQMEVAMGIQMAVAMGRQMEVVTVMVATEGGGWGAVPNSYARRSAGSSS